MKQSRSKLDKLGIFRELNQKTVKALLEQVIIKEYQAGEIIFFDGDIVDYLYIVARGKVKLSKFTVQGQEKIIHILSAGELINEMVLDRRNSSATVEMIEDGEIVSIRVDSLLELMAQDFELSSYILNSTILKLRQSYRQIRNLGLKKTGPRIASRLWKLARDYGQQNQEGVTIDLNLSQRELALMIGTRRETVSRFLNQLDESGVIKVGKFQITILDLDELEKWT